MKKLSIAFLMLATISITACKKDKTTDPVTIAGASATVTANNYGFDGATGKFSSTTAGITQVTAGGGTIFTITAIKDGTNESITLILLKAAAVGKVQVGPNLSNGGIIFSKDYTKPADASLNYSTDNSGAMTGGGEIIFTKVDGNSVEGTFYAVGYNNARKEAFAEQGAFKGTIK